ASERRYSAAIKYWKQALALQPDSPEIVLSMGIAVYESGDPNESIRVLAALLKDHPGMKSAHFSLGNIYADEYTEVVRLDPQDHVALLAKVKALTTVSAFQDALAPARDYVRQKPADPEGHLLLGSVYKGLGEYEPAELELKLAVAELPNDPQAQSELGSVLARNQKPQEALPHLEKALVLKPSDSSAQFQLAAVLRALGDDARSGEVANRFKASKSEEFKVNQLAAKGNQANELLQA